MKNENIDICCFSHLNWDPVFNRPHQLMTRASRRMRVFFIEEPVADDGSSRFVIRPVRENLFVVAPHVNDSDRENEDEVLRGLFRTFLFDFDINEPVNWYYTPGALEWSREPLPSATVYDIARIFQGTADGSSDTVVDAELLQIADVVFAAGRRVFYARNRHRPDIHLFPSGVDYDHFEKALVSEPTPEQFSIRVPRIGYIGTIDRRIDPDILKTAAEVNPDWSFILIGPIEGISENDLPVAENIHYLGPRPYADLPYYLAGWQAAMIPFVLDASTSYTNPVKTAEYLAAGLPVVSTALPDVVDPYGKQALVHIAENTAEFIGAMALALQQNLTVHRERCRSFLSSSSWDRTFEEMWRLITQSQKETPLNKVRAARSLPLS